MTALNHSLRFAKFGYRAGPFVSIWLFEALYREGACPKPEPRRAGRVVQGGKSEHQSRLRVKVVLDNVQQEQFLEKRICLFK